MNNHLKQNKKSCDDCRDEGLNSLHTEKKYPDHTSALSRIKKIKGQIMGLERMIQDHRYCVDILIQFRAIASALNVVETSVLEKHIRSCVKEALESKNKKEIETKLGELMTLISKRL